MIAPYHTSGFLMYKSVQACQIPGLYDRDGVRQYMCNIEQLHSTAHLKEYTFILRTLFHF